MQRWYFLARSEEVSQEVSPSEFTWETTRAGLEDLERPGQRPRESGSVSAVVW